MNPKIKTTKPQTLPPPSTPHPTLSTPFLSPNLPLKTASQALSAYSLLQNLTNPNPLLLPASKSLTNVTPTTVPSGENASNSAGQVQVFDKQRRLAPALSAGGRGGCGCSKVGGCTGIAWVGARRREVRRVFSAWRRAWEDRRA